MTRKEKAYLWLLAVIAIALYFYLYFKRYRADLEIKLKDLKTKIKENRELDDKLQLKTNQSIKRARYLVVIIYLSLNLYLHFNICIGLNNLLMYNSWLFILTSAITFAKFGNLHNYNHWWHLVEQLIESWVYKKSPELKKLIEKQVDYKAKLEERIKDVDDILKSFN